MIAIVDYGVGNLFSLRSSFAAIGAEACVTGDPDALRAADAIVLPGVGAFGDAAKKLQDLQLAALLKEQAQAGKPLLGICLGMQLLFTKSYEYGEHEGLDLIPGEVVPMAGVLPEGYKIPHIGWNALDFHGRTCPLWRYIHEGERVYFVHSYYASHCDADTVATAEYGGVDLTACVARDNVYGCQFHPEKSGRVGLSILRAFCENI